ncbi:MAG: hypothetical protein H6680_09585 [Desulfobacteraceae bacterium]|nr:hypothetical protein [Desulfobacteraceae bacterium]
MKIMSTQAVQYRNTIYSRQYGDKTTRKTPFDEFLTFSTSRTTNYDLFHSKPVVNGYNDYGEYLQVNPEHDLVTPERHRYKPNPEDSIRSWDEICYESATMNFVSEGEVLTEDGRKIDFFYSMSLTRESHIIERLRKNKADNTGPDPLVINLKGGAPQFSGKTAKFDLDADGTDEEVSLLTEGNFFLSLDRNNDGVINNGSELFGMSGITGFEELKEYDSDNNDWIDENDEIFDQLTIMEMDDQGNMRLTTLKEKGVGAIFLRFEKNDFSLWNASSAGLNEDGSVCSVHTMNMRAENSSAPITEQLVGGDGVRRDKNGKVPLHKGEGSGFLEYLRQSYFKSETRMVYSSLKLKSTLFSATKDLVHASLQHHFEFQSVKIVFDTTHLYNAFDELWGKGCLCNSS